MNEQTNVQAQPVTLPADQAAKLAELAKRLQAQGSVQVQTTDDVGTETVKPTIH